MANAVVHLNASDCAVTVEALRLYGQAYPVAREQCEILAVRLAHHLTTQLTYVETEKERQQRVSGS